MPATTNAEHTPGTYRMDYFGGRSHGYVLDGAKVPGVTTLINGGLPKPNLIKWRGERVAEYVRDRWDDLVHLAPDEVYRLAREAPDAQRRAAMAKGSELHALAEQLGRGTEVEVPEHLLNTVIQLHAFLEDWNVEPLAVEFAVVNRTWRYMGTADLMCRLGPRRQLALIDYKTGSSGLWPEVALQLAAYAWAESYFPDPSHARFHEEYPMPYGPGDGPDNPATTKPAPRLAFDLVAALHLQDDGYELCPVDAGPDTWRDFLYVAQVAQFAEREREDLIGQPITPPSPGRAQ